ncbi:DUF5988 family protein [Streptomyces sp. MK37H]|uniref:DUF5988 family protein n=1 Tax=Streptomyces sp. MK37H TaxID=2699117 RepID=UPI001B392755|nr:DUF5988 family protein [Streptomyces sp. MK37H]MBP8532285.1 hypothetical protein [Streptomyces sp. MK37H]
MTAVQSPRANVLLRGGPASQMSEAERVRYVADPALSLKIQRGNRYEHFEPTPETVSHDGSDLQVFAWSRVTYVAE